MTQEAKVINFDEKVDKHHGLLHGSGMFATPESIKQMWDYTARFSGGEAVVAMTCAGMMGNLCAKLTSHLPALPKPPEGIGSNGRIIASVPHPHPDDQERLFLVLVEYDEKLVSWLYNDEDEGFHWGHYYDGSTKQEALNCFYQRVSALIRTEVDDE